MHSATPKNAEAPPLDSSFDATWKAKITPKPVNLQDLDLNAYVELDTSAYAQMLPPLQDQIIKTPLDCDTRSGAIEGSWIEAAHYARLTNHW